ncbi:unnamed protein product [Cuscuta campestris]|uniref:DUF506 domain-containing protein n=1 Tax=Cuscuta campestris TaxID=132261 RepID=A0A484MLA7_9ASTE|nr:unnamed protein product [Cuscuta campestris]
MVPARFKRVADAFDEAALTLRTRPPCGSSGSEHSDDPESLTDLSRLVNSFIENDDDEAWEGPAEWAVEDVDDDDGRVGDDRQREEENCCDDVVEARDSLQRLLSSGEDDVTKRSLLEAVERSRRELGERSYNSPDFKRRLMGRLRNQGFDAGLCKTRWEKKESCPRGDYEYIDVNANGERYIVEFNLRGELETARPTAGYRLLAEMFGEAGAAYVGRAEELKKIARIMSGEMKRSMKSVGMHVPPWRRSAYVQAKWFSSYKRTTNNVRTARDDVTLFVVPLSSSSSASCSTSWAQKQRRWVGFDLARPADEIALKERMV